MKILYVKNNSERAKAFQLKTIIYEEDGQKFVKKEALTTESIPHLKKMKISYEKLSSSIIDPRIKFAKIVKEDEKSLTFEFIDGESLEERFQNAMKIGSVAVEKVIQDYSELLNYGFKTCKFDYKSMVTDEFKLLFGDRDYTSLSNQQCFEGVGSIDLIFSNIIYKNEKIYFIDYEWTYDLNIPVDYIEYRTMEMLSALSKNIANKEKAHAFLYHKMERNFVDDYVMNNGFYFQKYKYIKASVAQTEYIHGKEEHIQELIANANGKEEHIQEISSNIQKIGDDLAYARAVINLRDQQLEFQNNHLSFMYELTLNKRLKQKIKQIIPNRLLTLLGYEPYELIAFDTASFPQEIKFVSARPIYVYHQPEVCKKVETTISNFNKHPLISIVMPVYNVDPKWLDKAIKSIENQWYPNWELCLADDKSTDTETLAYLGNIKNPKIKITYLPENMNISSASNAALKLAEGEYIALMDNDDEITADALYEMVKAINEEDAEFIYSDEDFISVEGQCSNPHFKPDFSPDLLLSHNYITHFTCFKKSLLDKVGHFDSKFDGAQDYDLFLRLTEKTDNIYHIQKVLYHWRTIEGSTSADSEAKPEAIERGRKVLQNTLKRRAIEGTVEHANMHHYFRVKYSIKSNPLVSIVIPFKDKPELLDMCVNSILEKSTYQNYEIIGISNNSEASETFEMMTVLEKKDARVAFYEYNTEFNYADINNHAVNTYAKGEHLLLLNNDIEVITPDWIEAMLEHSQREEIGCVGAKLYFPNDTVQHAGVIIGLGGYAGHSHKMYPRENPGYFNRLGVVQNVSAVTAACLMIKKCIYQEIGGMDEVKFKVAYNDVDFCLRVVEEGYLNIFTPYTEMYHHESISRGYETTPEKIARFETEKDALFERHRGILENGDPYYNPNLTSDREDFSICSKA